MSNRLHQLNASYDPMQDRVVLAIGTEDGTEFRFWLTRRFLQVLWTVLGKVATACAAARAGGDPIRREALTEMAHHEAHRHADFQAPYRAGEKHPLGADPVLVAKIVVRQTPAGPASVSLLPPEGQGVDLGLDERMTHLLASLLQRVAIQAEWQLVLPPLAPPAMGDAASPPQLH